MGEGVQGIHGGRFWINFGTYATHNPTDSAFACMEMLYSNFSNLKYALLKQCFLPFCIFVFWRKILKLTSPAWTLISKWNKLCFDLFFVRIGRNTLFVYWGSGLFCLNYWQNKITEWLTTSSPPPHLRVFLVQSADYTANYFWNLHKFSATIKSLLAVHHVRFKRYSMGGPTRKQSLGSRHIIGQSIKRSRETHTYFKA